jgi:hypothetical protein
LYILILYSSWNLSPCGTGHTTHTGHATLSLRSTMHRWYLRSWQELLCDDQSQCCCGSSCNHRQTSAAAPAHVLTLLQAARGVCMHAKHHFAKTKPVLL